MFLTVLYYNIIYCTILLDYEGSSSVIKVGSVPNLVHRNKCEKNCCPRYEGSGKQVEKLGEVVEDSDA